MSAPLVALIIDWDDTAWDRQRYGIEYASTIDDYCKGERSFRDGELAPFVYPDTRRILAACIALDIPRVLLTYEQNPAYQEAKIKSSGLWPDFTHRIITDGRKGPALRNAFGRQESYYKGYVFVDDRQEHLDSVRKHCPGITCIRMDRTLVRSNAPGVIATFDSLMPLLVP